MLTEESCQINVISYSVAGLKGTQKFVRVVGANEDIDFGYSVPWPSQRKQLRVTRKVNVRLNSWQQTLLTYLFLLKQILKM